MKPWWAVCQSQCELLDHFPLTVLLTSICDGISTGVYLRLNLTLEIVLDWMVLLCPCIYCTVDKNSKLEVSSGLNFFSFDFFIRLENISTSVFCWGESLLKFHFKSFQASIYWQPWKPFRTSSQTPTITFACFIKAQILCNINSMTL